MATSKEKKIRETTQSDLLDAEHDAALSPEEINFKVQRAQQALLELKRQQEEIERQKRELEELSQKQEEFKFGRKDILDKLNRGLVILERKEFEIKKTADQIEAIRESFAEHLQQMQEIDSDSWPQEDLSTELTKALTRIDQAQSVYEQSRLRFEAMSEETDGDAAGFDDPTGYSGSRRSFGSLVRDGFAYSLPLLIVLFILIVVLIFHH